MTVELLPCPFCGGTNIQHVPGDHISCMNVNCGGQVDMGSPWGGPDEDGTAFLVAAWNTRPRSVPGGDDPIWRLLVDHTRETWAEAGGEAGNAWNGSQCRVACVPLRDRILAVLSQPQPKPDNHELFAKNANQSEGVREAVARIIERHVRSAAVDMPLSNGMTIKGFGLGLVGVNEAVSEILSLPALRGVSDGE